MNQLNERTPDLPPRSFTTDVPRADLAPVRPPATTRLWAGMAAAAVVAAVSVVVLAAPAPSAGEIPTAGAPAARAGQQQPVDPFSESSDYPGPRKPAAGQQQGTPAAAPAKKAAVPPVPRPVKAPARRPAPRESNLYTVVAGDTVGAIAARYGLDMNAVLAANGLAPYSIIIPGQTLVLRGRAAATAPAAAAAPAAPAAPPPAAAPVPAPVPAVTTALVPAAPSVRTIQVAGAGGQAMVDACIGPIHYTPNDGYSLFITEHDFCGGWARFSGIGVGETVSIPGYGTFTATGRGQVPNPGTTNDVIAVFGGFPRAILQTCIPGTSQMLLIALN